MQFKYLDSVDNGEFMCSGFCFAHLDRAVLTAREKAMQTFSSLPTGAWVEISLSQRRGRVPAFVAYTLYYFLAINWSQL